MTSLIAGCSYQVGVVTHTFPQLSMSGSYVYTTKQAQHLQAILSLLSYFDTLCEDKQLEYVICGNTLLGALRHDGFIPWLDYVTVEMRDTEIERLHRTCKGLAEIKQTRSGCIFRVKGVTLEVLAVTTCPHTELRIYTDPALTQQYPNYRNSYTDIHPRRRAVFENISLWMPQESELLCRRLFGATCFTTAVLPSRSRGLFR